MTDGRTQVDTKEMQKEVDDWVQGYTVPYWSSHEQLARLVEEVGELAREINHQFGPKKKKASEDTNELSAEIGDILFTLICFANSHEIHLDDAFRSAMDKCYRRDKDRYEKHTHAQ